MHSRSITDGERSLTKRSRSSSGSFTRRAARRYALKADVVDERQRGLNLRLTFNWIMRGLRSVSRVNLGGVAEIETDRFHDPERCARGEYVGRPEYAGVLLDDRRCSGVRDRVEVLLDRGPGVLAVLLEIRRRVNRVDRCLGVGGDVGHVLLVQGHVVAGSEPGDVTAHEV